MQPHELDLLHIVHVFGVLALFGTVFYACGAPQETRKRALMNSGLAALIVLATGLRLWQGLYGFAFLGWIVVKIVCWVGLAALVGVAYRRRERARLIVTAALLLALVALLMVYLKPSF